MKETILPITEFGDRYYISDQGNVYSKYSGELKTLAPGDQGTGYLSIPLRKEGKQKNITIHRLVAKAFVPNPKNNPFINHIDGNKHNNSANNLEWVTHKENMHHAKINNLMESGERRYNSKLSDADAEKIRNSTEVGRRLAEKYNVSPSLICMIRQNRIRRKGFKTMYQDAVDALEDLTEEFPELKEMTK